MAKWSVEQLPALVSALLLFHVLNVHTILFLFYHLHSIFFLSSSDYVLILVPVFVSGLWLEQLDPVEHLQSYMWRWCEKEVSLRDQSCSGIWWSSLQRRQSWDWYLQHWALLWLVVSLDCWCIFICVFSICKTFRTITKWFVLQILLVFIDVNTNWVLYSCYVSQVWRIHGAHGQSAQWHAEEVTEHEPVGPFESMALLSSSVPVICSLVVQHSLTWRQKTCNTTRIEKTCVLILISVCTLLVSWWPGVSPRSGVDAVCEGGSVVCRPHNESQQELHTKLPVSTRGCPAGG